MDSTKRTEEELEDFRRQWKEEVNARTQKKATSSKKSPSTSGPGRIQRDNVRRPHIRLPLAHADEDGLERSYHDIGEKEYGIRLGEQSNAETAANGTSAELSSKEPKTALEYYEKAAESEGQGRLGDSLSDYRKAFKLDAKVQEQYKKKHFPSTNLAKKDHDAAITAVTDSTEVTNHSKPVQLLPIQDLIASYAHLAIEPEPPATSFSPAPPCPIANIPEEVLVDILIATAEINLPSLVQLSQTSKRLAYLTVAEDTIWRQLIHDSTFGFPAMLYDYRCSIEWGDVIDNEGAVHEILEANQRASLLRSFRTLPLSTAYPSYRQMFRTRPRIRFNGCYISTVNYTRPGAVGSNSLTWNHNILIVTYYRYLRFFRDGSVVSLLTTSEPADVVPYLQKEYVRYQSHGGGQLPQAVMKDSLRGRWRLSGDPYGTKAATSQTAPNADVEAPNPEDVTEGDIHIETEGVVNKYKYIMQLRFGSTGRGSGTRNNKLNWVGYWCQNKLTDDIGEFGMKNYRPYFWSRVRSWY